MEKKNCSKCGEEKSVKEFNWRNKSQSKRQCICKFCTRLMYKQHYLNNKKYYSEKAIRFNAERRKNNRRLLLDYFSNHHCVDCGEKDPRCLTFDHVRGKKTMGISSMIGDCNWKQIQKEIKKCDVRCSNCHMKKTADDFGWFTSISPTSDSN